MQLAILVVLASISGVRAQVGCPVDTWNQLGSITCTPCPDNSTSVLGSSSPDACWPAGTVGTTSSCSACDLGRYDHDANAASPCVSCPVDTYQDQLGSIICTPCPVDEYLEGGGCDNSSCKIT
jgi:hypothetical protein